METVKDVGVTEYSKYIKTEETTDYSLFIIPIHQRDENDSNVRGVMDSIKELGVVNAICVRPSKESQGKYEVYEGQHILTACKRLNAPVVYNVFRDVSNRAIILLNNKSRNWKLGDYLKWGVTDNMEDYRFLDKVYKGEKIPLTALIMMYGGFYANKSFKSLKWKALTVQRGNDMLRYVKDFEKTYNIKQSRYARFIWGLGVVVDSGKYDHERMMLQLSKCSRLLTKQENTKGYTENIQDGYNYGLSNKVQFTQK